MLELYHHGTSVCAAKVRLALAEKKLDWEGHYIDILKGEQFNEKFLNISPKAVVPILVHDSEVIQESTVICEYLDEMFDDNKIYPVSSIERARVRLWTKAVDEELHPACSTITYTVSHRHTILRNGSGSFDDFMAKGSPVGQAARAMKWQWIHEGLEAPGAEDKIRLYDTYLKKMEKALEKDEWLTGDKYTMADIAMTPYLFRLSALSMEGLWKGGRLKNVEKWFDKVKDRPSFQQAVLNWVPEDLAKEMLKNGRQSWSQIKEIVDF